MTISIMQAPLELCDWEKGFQLKRRRAKEWAGMLWMSFGKFSMFSLFPMGEELWIL